MSYLEERRNQKLYGKPQAEKRKYYIPKKSAKKMAQEKADKESGTDAAMDYWHEEGRKRMTGKCIICGGRTEKDNDNTYRHSNAHLFAKNKNAFPSIKLHLDNRIELCFYGNSCHTNFDQHIIEFQDIKEDYPLAWNEIVQKTAILHPVMTAEEKNKIPEILLEAIKQIT